MLEEKPLEIGENREKKNTANNLFSNVLFYSLNSQKTRKTTFFFCFLKRALLRTQGTIKIKTTSSIK